MTENLNVPTTAKQMVAEARGRVESITPEQVVADVKQGALLIDLRETEECVEHGVIPDAVHFPRGMLEFWADPNSAYHRQEFDPSRRIILHCMAGGRSSLAADTLQQLGFKNVAHMDGGFERWSLEGRPVLGGHKDS